MIQTMSLLLKEATCLLTVQSEYGKYSHEVKIKVRLAGDTVVVICSSSLRNFATSMTDGSQDLLTNVVNGSAIWTGRRFSISPKQSNILAWASMVVDICDPTTTSLSSIAAQN